MDKEEYYKRIEKINNRFRTDRVSADEEYQLVCQRNYLSTKYIEHLEQQCKQQKEVINKVNKYLNEYDVFKVFSFPLMKRWEEEQIKSSIDYEFKTSLVKDLKDILKEVSE